MKGSFLALAFVLSSFFIANAQIRVALVLGGHQSEVIEENDLPDFSTFKNGYSGRTGVHFGFLADVPFAEKSNLFFQPGIVFFNKGRKFAGDISGGNGTVFQSSEQFVNYIDLPLNLVYKFRLNTKTKLIIGAGPYASFFYNGKETKEINDQGVFTSEENTDLPVGDAPGKYKVLNYGANALAGLEFGRVFLTANYSRGLNDFYQAKDYTGTFKHQVIGATLGIFLGPQTAPEKKIKDRDKDGIPDEQDACPDEAGPAITKGCPDKDADGIPDKEDNCIDVPGILAYKGCPAPKDKDGDGITDDLDKCPDIPGVARYNGCPVPDSDNDGVNDDDDKCPQVVGLGRYEGCPVPDTDNDGVNDEDDKCPKVPGLKENNGCPAIQQEIVEKVNYAAKRIQFEFAKASLLKSSFKVLDEVVMIMKQNPELKLSIEGHTSADANYNANIQLSQDRADNVKTYFESKGIDSGRLSAKGFGPSQPLNSGKTEAEKAQNRRVELKLSN